MDNTKSFKIEAQEIRVEEETKMRMNALQSVVNRTNLKLIEPAGSNGQNSSNLVPA